MAREIAEAEARRVLERATRGMTIDEIRRLPATVSVEIAAEAVGVSRSSMYQWIAEDGCPLRTIRVRRTLRVITGSIIDWLEGNGHQAASA